MDVDKLIHYCPNCGARMSFGPLMDVDKLIRKRRKTHDPRSFGPLMDVDKLILVVIALDVFMVLGL